MSNGNGSTDEEVHIGQVDVYNFDWVVMEPDFSGL